MSEIIWPKEYLPGTTDNYVSNEIIVADLCVAKIWKYINNTVAWPTYYSNVSGIIFHDDTGPKLSSGAHFGFTTFGFEIEAKIVEYVTPSGDQPARVAWHAWMEGDADHRFDAYHALLFEDLPGGRLRILTRETQNGKAAKEISVVTPNPMLNAHQEWINGLAFSAKNETLF